MNTLEKWARWTDDGETTRWHRIKDERQECDAPIRATATAELRFDRPDPEDMCAACLRIVLNKWATDVLVPKP